MTGLPGRRAFNDLYRRLAAGTHRRGSGVILLLIDIENLSGINNEMGYSFGDDVLKSTAEALLESSRATDLIARCGGAEFAVLLIATEISQCDVLTRRVNEKLADLTRQRGLHGVIRYDVGVAVNDTPTEDLDTMMRIADEEMRKRKKRKTAGQSG